MGLEPPCDQRSMFICPMLVELFLRQFGVALRANCDAHKLIGRHDSIVFQEGQYVFGVVGSPLLKTREISTRWCQTIALTVRSLMKEYTVMTS